MTKLSHLMRRLVIRMRVRGAGRERHESDGQSAGLHLILIQ